MSAQAKRCRRVMARYGFRGQQVGEASNPGPPRRRSQFDTQLDSSESDAVLVPNGRFAMLSSTSDDALAVAVRCSGECEDHGRVAVRPDVESRSSRGCAAGRFSEPSSSEHPRIEEGGFGASKSGRHTRVHP